MFIKEFMYKKELIWESTLLYFKDMERSIRHCLLLNQFRLHIHQTINIG